MKMLENNTDYGLLEMNFFKSDQEYKVYYDIEGLIQLNQYIMGEALEEGKLYKILYIDLNELDVEQAACGVLPKCPASYQSPPPIYLSINKALPPMLHTTHCG